jgi:hypothetical protein
MKLSYFSQSNPYVLITAFFVVSRIFYIGGLGVRFDASSLRWFWQFIEVDLLAHDLWRSVYYLHQQPPLFNLFLGIIIKLFGSYRDLAFQISFLAMGITMAFSLFALMEEMGVKRYIALTITIAATITPGIVAYENWLFYEYPTAMLICLCALALCRLLKQPRYGQASAFFLWITLLFFRG